MQNHISDAELVKRVQGGDKRSFDLLVLKYQQKIVNLVMRYVKDQADAMDVSQEVFIKAYRALPGFRGDSAFYTWLYRIAINTAKNVLASQNRRPQTDDIDISEVENLQLGKALRDSDTPEGHILSDEIAHTVQGVLNELPDDLRTALILREMEGMSYEEIALAMNCPIGTVRSRIFRAREAIDIRIKPLISSE